jgi:flavin reductase (DIM6/NTAB) family NADH-FMN oxidoreductase RutF
MHILDKKALRSCLGRFLTGVTVVTTLGMDGRRHGVTANSFSSVSLDPPLVLWCQSIAAPSHNAFLSTERFAINILAADQIELSNRFARPAEDKFAGVAFEDGIGGVPLLAGCVGQIECVTERTIVAGDHAIFLGRVENFQHCPGDELVFGGGRYLVAQPHADILVKRESYPRSVLAAA